MPAERIHCKWCGRHNRTPATGSRRTCPGCGSPLCVRCADKRLNNPWNTLLPMRKIETAATAAGKD